MAYQPEGHFERFALMVLAACLLLCCPLRASAQSTDKVLAEQLFRTGQELMSQKRFGEACPKLAESQRLDPGTGTLLNLAVCHEQEGKLASAWSEYNDAAALARRDQRADRVQYAEQHALALEPKLSRLTVQLAPDADVAGLEIRLDGEQLGRAAFGVATPVDPGSHTVSAKAPGKRAWQTSVDVPADAAKRSVVVPKLEDGPPEPSGAKPEQTESEPAKDPGKTQRIAAYALGGVGIVSLGVGTYFGVRAISKNQQSEDEGCSGNMCPPAAADTRRSAQSAGNVSTVMFIVGGVALAGGVTLLLTAPRGHSESAPAAPRASLRIAPGSVGIDGTW